MSYYKVINGTTFIGIATTTDLRRFLYKNRVLIISSENNAQYIQIGNNLFHDSWMKKPEPDIDYDVADVIQITQEEYEELYEMIERDEEITPEPEIEPSPEPEPEQEDITVEYAKTLKIKEMNKVCQNAIFGGINVELSDGETHHFSLTEYDQLNLFKLETLARSGEIEYLPYHEDEELCKFYPAIDIITIVNVATSFITYHTTYFNSLKHFIKSLDSIALIANVFYGISIPEEFQSDVLKELNKAEETQE